LSSFHVGSFTKKGGAMLIEYLRLLDDLSTCNLSEMENLVVQLVLLVKNDKTKGYQLQDNLREICETKVDKYYFWIKERNGQQAFFAILWLQKFMELTEINYLVILEERHHHWHL